MYIRKNDEVTVIAGKAKGQRGKVVAIDRERNRVTVEKVNMVKRHTRPNPKSPQGGILSKEAPVHVSNVNLYCPKCEAPSRVAVKVLEDGTKGRICKKCDEVIEPKE
jgi:large subunit ribosomal protein L24